MNYRPVVGVARQRVCASLCAVLLLPLLVACGGASKGTASASNAPVASAVPSASASASSSGGPGSLAFDDGSPGRLAAVRAADGNTTATVELDTTGAPVTKIMLSAANEAADVTGLEVPMTGSAGAWTGQVLLPLPGLWTFEVVVQRNDNGFKTEDFADVSVTL